MGSSEAGGLKQKMRRRHLKQGRGGAEPRCKEAVAEPAPSHPRPHPQAAGLTPGGPWPQSKLLSFYSGKGPCASQAKTGSGTQKQRQRPRRLEWEAPHFWNSEGTSTVPRPGIQIQGSVYFTIS